jgi:hypothetical protein
MTGRHQGRKNTEDLLTKIKANCTAARRGLPARFLARDFLPACAITRRFINADLIKMREK